MKFFQVVAIATTLTVLLAGGAHAADLAETVCNAETYPQLSTLCTVAGASPDALAALTGEGDLTLLAPTNDAFVALESTVGFDIITYLANDNEANANALFSVLAYHLFAGEIRSTDLADGDAATVNGASLNITAATATFTDELGRDAVVQNADIDADNGVVHIVDAVVVTQAIFDALPTADIVGLVSGTDDLATLLAAVQAADLADALSEEGPFTVFAPSNSAFEDLESTLGWGVLNFLLNDFNQDALASIVLGHAYTDASAAGRVYSSQISEDQSITTLAQSQLTFGVGESVTVATDFSGLGDATVTAADVDATNGVAHIVDTVLVTTEQASALPTSDIVDLAIATEDLSTLVTALQEAELVDTLRGDGPFTVFAPTNAAFDLLPEGTLDALLADIEDLTTVLTYHVYSADGPEGRVYSSQLTDGQTVPTLQGETLTVSVGTSVVINDAAVSVADIQGTNGVVHIIDAVLIPEALGGDDDDDSSDDDDDSPASAASSTAILVCGLAFAAVAALL